MKVYALKPDDQENFLSVKSAHFTEDSREALRQHTLSETQADFVWFEDEEPPNKLIIPIMEEEIRQKTETVTLLRTGLEAAEHLMESLSIIIDGFELQGFGKEWQQTYHNWLQRFSKEQLDEEFGPRHPPGADPED